MSSDVVGNDEEMGTWNYRVIRKNDFCEIHEVYYNTKGDPIAFTENSCSPCGDSMEELIDDLEYFKDALELPVFDYDKLCDTCTLNSDD